MRQAEAETLRERVETKELLHLAFEERVSHLSAALDCSVRAYYIITYMYMYLYMYIYIYIYIYVCVCIYMCIYIHIYIQ